MNASERTRAWYVLHTKSRHENVVYEGLAKKRFEAFLPKITVKSRRRDRHCMMRVPLFPGYLFVCTDLDPREHLDIVKTVGAVRLVLEGSAVSRCRTRGCGQAGLSQGAFSFSVGSG